MKYFVVLFFLFVNVVYGNLATSKYLKEDLKVLKELNLPKKFIYDKDLNDIFKKYSRNSHIHKYAENIEDASMYIAEVKNILKTKKLPFVILSLPMAESNFNMHTSTSSKTAGIWQFIPSTAKIFKLKNNKYVDERLDIIKSTNAASDYLLHQYKRFNKWYLAILAYNCGEGRIIEAITRLKIKAYLKKYPHQKNSQKIKEYIKTINTYLKTKKGFYKVNKIYKIVRKWNVKIDVIKLLNFDKNLFRQYIPEESRIYLRKIITFAFLNDRNFYQKKSLFVKAKNNIIPVKSKKSVDLKEVSKALKLSYKSLLAMNLHLKKQKVPNKNIKDYNIYIPKNKGKLYTKYSKKVQKSIFLKYKVKRGDTLSLIGRKYKIRYGKIKDINNLKSNKLSINQTLLIPKYH